MLCPIRKRTSSASTKASASHFTQLVAGNTAAAKSNCSFALVRAKSKLRAWGAPARLQNEESGFQIVSWLRLDSSVSHEWILCQWSMHKHQCCHVSPLRDLKQVFHILYIQVWFDKVSLQKKTLDFHADGHLDSMGAKLKQDDGNPVWLIQDLLQACVTHVCKINDLRQSHKLHVPHELV